MKKISIISILLLSVLILSSNFGLIPDALKLHMGEKPVYGSTSEDNVISGQVILKETGLSVHSGCVKALKYDWEKDMILVLDSTAISSTGHFTLTKAPKDSLFIMAYGDDEEADFTPGYHDTSINWQTSLRVIPTSNLNNVNIKVNQVSKRTESPHSIGGRIFKDPNYQNGYINDAVIYAKLDNYYKGFCISDQNGHYLIDSLPSGNIELFVVRIGYNTDYKIIQLGEFNIDTVDFYLSKVSSVNIPVKKIPLEYSLSQNTPNPFNPVTKIKFDLPKSNPGLNNGQGFVRLVIYDALGREAAELVNQHLPPGSYEVEWDGTNYPSGVYFYKLITDNVILTKKMVLVK
jgi:hypothetical protein